ncbi:hemerythrin domain-containing protein [Tenggerimyces flavus]|uniref:Hemerythrin domain-containing protein n=1 Tax=Tenggerimyces flavus TaxID=1708749 RepID=A0ABV7Y7M9_9ACTN|nr:hemerythrin domain-containing protein [Tenggerimyces flavus]MBM7785561.1 hemerythrin-like domain-containing protein [Tenggerimyces flavus]
MSRETGGPADIRDMGIVHSALRRDLRRVRMVLTADGEIAQERRRAIGEHLVWLMHSLHVHHTGEDTHLWPEIRRREPSAGALLDVMDADHKRIAGPIGGIEKVGTAYAAGSADAAEVLAAVDQLEAALLPHLAREEQQMMPVVAQVLTDTEYEELGERAFIKPKSFSDLAMEGHWVLDNATPEVRELMVSKIPAVPRWILLNLLGGPYQRRRKAAWEGTPAADLAPVPAESLS